MLVAHFLSLLLTSTAVVYSQAIVYDSIHNATSIVGTWSSGSKAVSTGPGFCNPLNRTFIYPQTTGISYSFTEDGYYEISRYRFNGNGSEPTCITGVMNWVHGMYALQPNGSITMVPFDSDGFQQIQDPCAAVSNFIEIYNDTELYVQWRIFQDPTQGYKLHLFQYDGSPLAPQFQISTTPNMLPTTKLTQHASHKTVLKRALVQRSDAAGQHIKANLWGAVVLSLLALTSSLGL